MIKLTKKYHMSSGIMEGTVTFLACLSKMMRDMSYTGNTVAKASLSKDRAEFFLIPTEEPSSFLG